MSAKLFCRPPDKGVVNEVNGGGEFSENPPLALLART